MQIIRLKKRNDKKRKKKKREKVKHNGLFSENKYSADNIT